MMRYSLAVFLFTTFFVPPLAAQDLTGTLKQIKDAGEIRIGFRETEPPMSFLSKNGAPIGYSIDICRQIVTEVERKVGKDVKISYVPVTAEDRFSALTDNKIDILCGSTTVTLARREIVDFTELTFVTGASLMSLKSANLLDFPSLSGKKVGVVKDTTTVQVLRATLKQTEGSVGDLNSGPGGLEQLRSGAIDAFSSDQVVLIGLAITADDTSNFAIAAGVFSFEPFALALRRNDADFRLVADRAISQLYPTEQILPIYEKWMGQFSSERPPVFDMLFELNAIPEG